jgi:flagellar motor switch protein FliM
LVKKIQANSRKYDRPTTTEKAVQWQDSYANIKMPIAAEWSSFELTVRDLLALREGDLLELPPAILSDTKIRLANSYKFKGEVGLEGDHVAVKITERLKKDN